MVIGNVKAAKNIIMDKRLVKRGERIGAARGGDSDEVATLPRVDEGDGQAPEGVSRPSLEAQGEALCCDCNGEWK